MATESVEVACVTVVAEPKSLTVASPDVVDNSTVEVASWGSLSRSIGPPKPTVTAVAMTNPEASAMRPLRDGLAWVVLSIHD